MDCMESDADWFPIGIPPPSILREMLLLLDGAGAPTPLREEPEVEFVEDDGRAGATRFGPVDIVRYEYLDYTGGLEVKKGGEVLFGGEKIKFVAKKKFIFVIRTVMGG